MPVFIIKQERPSALSCSICSFMELCATCAKLYLFWGGQKAKAVCECVRQRASVCVCVSLSPTASSRDHQRRRGKKWSSAGQERGPPSNKAGGRAEKYLAVQINHPRPFSKTHSCVSLPFLSFHCSSSLRFSPTFALTLLILNSSSIVLRNLRSFFRCTAHSHCFLT